MLIQHSFQYPTSAAVHGGTYVVVNGNSVTFMYANDVHVHLRRCILASRKAPPWTKLKNSFLHEC